VNLPPPASVRAVLFHPSDRSITAGSLDGAIWSLPLGGGAATGDDDDPSMICMLPGSVSSLAYQPATDVLAAGIITGEVATVDPDGTATVLRTHAEGMEVWSVAFSPWSVLDLDFMLRIQYGLHPPHNPTISWQTNRPPAPVRSGGFLATSSEDHTTKIWRWENGAESRLALLETLSGHMAAVTCNDWVQTTQESAILVTSSDDRTVRCVSAQGGR
jgi:WD40 repeat protein